MGAFLRTAATALLVLAALSGAGAARANDQRPAVQVGGTRFDALDPQQLEPGHCGLFLWARAQVDQPVFIFAAFDQPAEARVRENGDRRRLPRTAFAGEPVFGHFERQTYSDGRITLDVDVDFDDTRQLHDGAVIKSGAIKFTNAEGWETVLPVGGMVACQHQP